MDFPFDFNPPDPHQLQQALYRIKDAFQRAAEAETGAAQPLFQNLSDKFNTAVDSLNEIEMDEQNLDPIKLVMKIGPMVMDLQRTQKRLIDEAGKNPAAAEALRELQETMQEEMKGLMSGISFGGQNPFGTSGDSDNDNIEPPAPKPAQKPKFPKPPKPGKGDFKL